MPALRQGPFILSSGTAPIAEKPCRVWMKHRIDGMTQNRRNTPEGRKKDAKG